MNELKEYRQNTASDAVIALVLAALSGFVVGIAVSWIWGMI